MSQATSTGTNFNSIITPWNRTPGKPGIGSNNINSISTYLTSTSSLWTATTKTTALDLPSERDNPPGVILATSIPQTLPFTDKTSKSEAINSLVVVSHADPKTSEVGQMWPPPVFEPSRVSDTDVSVTVNQWSVPSFGGSSSNNYGAANPWAFNVTSSSSNCPLPRAITGQQSFTINSTESEQNRHFVNWTLGTESDLLNEDRSGLALPLSCLSIDNHLSEFNEGQSHNTNILHNPRSGDNLQDAGLKLTLPKKCDSDIEVLPCDSDEAIRSAVNTTEPWGLHPVDQSTPWNLADINGDLGSSLAASSVCGSPSINELSATTHLPHNASAGINDSLPPGSQHSRRLGPLGTNPSSRDESNVWPSEPPNGTGIWESHYESLGERTARWQQTSTLTASTQPMFQSSFTNQSGFSSGSAAHPSALRSRPPQSNQVPSTLDNLPPYFRGASRCGPTAGIFPSALPNSSIGVNVGTRSLAGTTHPLASLNVASGPVGSGGIPSRGFPLSANTMPLGPSNANWPYSPTSNLTETAILGTNVGNKSRWPNANFGRLLNKQQHPGPHILPNQNPNNLRWSPHTNPPQIPPVWPMPDQRRPALVLGQWPAGTDNTSSGFFGHPLHNLHPRATSHQNSVPDFSTSLFSARGITQTFRPQSAFYSGVTSSGFPSSSVSQRMFLTPQQHSQQLQQQSMIRAHIMRQLTSLGFSEDEIQTIFADTNINVERALVELRDRSGHPGIDELLNYVKSVNSFIGPSVTNEESINAELNNRLDHSGGPGRPITMRSNQGGFNDQHAKLSHTSAIASENLEFSLNMLQQRETQILQTIMQLHSKHQELTQKLSHLANVPFATSPVLQELQLQSVQVGQQIEAQQAQLKHVRSQAGVLKQIMTPSNHPTSQHILPLSTSTLPTNVPLVGSACGGISTTSGGVPVSGTSWPVGAAGMYPSDNKTSVNSIDALEPGCQDQSGFNMNLSGSLLWDSNLWSGSNAPQVYDNYSFNKPIDKRWAPSNRFLLASSHIPSLGDPRWTDSVSESMGTFDCNLLSDTQTSACDMDERSAKNVPTSISSKSWILVHNIPPHVSVGMLKLIVSSALNNHAKSGDRIQDTPDFEIHPNMSVRWILLGLSTSNEASIVHDCLDGPNSGQPSGYFGSVKMISPNEALLRLQDIQSLASRFKSLGTEGSSSMHLQHSGNQANCVLSEYSSGMLNSDMPGSTQLIGGSLPTPNSEPNPDLSAA